jgi:hypothetical protein
MGQLSHATRKVQVYTQEKYDRGWSEVESINQSQHHLYDLLYRTVLYYVLYHSAES